MLAGFASVAHAGAPLPVGGTVVQGVATISGNTNSTTVTQNSSRAVINWASFDVVAGKSVVFNQPDAQSATLNRVTGSTTSTIAGQITSNGAVYLVNPNGIAITSTGSVNTAGGFVASTLDIADADFMAGKLNFAGSGASGSVTNAGHIAAGQGAYVALLGGSVSNSGTINVPYGTVGLGSGESIALDLNGNGFMQVAVPSALLTGSNALIANSGSIATSGGTVQLQAAVVKDAIRNVINMSGTINADSATGDGGTIHLIGGADTANMAGTVTVNGSLSARATGPTGNGGNIETSGATVDFAGVNVNTSSANGKTGNWLVDPFNLIIDVAAAATISQNLATNNVTIATYSDGSTTSPGIQYYDPYAGAAPDYSYGNITISAPISWSSNTSLFIQAYKNINITSPITAMQGALYLDAGNFSPYQGTITDTAAVNIGTFVLQNGNWIQNSSVLPAFSANNFQPSYYSSFSTFGSTFLRVTGGTGSSSNPYQIADVYGLQGINSRNGSPVSSSSNGPALLSANYVLANNIDGSVTSTWNNGQGFLPIGLSPVFYSNPIRYSYGANTASYAFIGSLNGQGHTINGLVINNWNASSIGLFAQIDLAGTVSNLGLIGGAITGNALSQSSLSIGAITGQSAGTLSNIFSTASVTATGVWANNISIGGLVGSSNGAIRNSHVNALITSSGGNQLVGGLVGNNSNQIINSYALGTIRVSNDSSDVGGLVGDNTGGFISSSYANNAVHVPSNATFGGGIAGKNYAGGNIQDSYSIGSLTADDSATFSGVVALGGIVGGNYSSVNNTYSAEVIGTSGSNLQRGGLQGFGSGAAATNSYWDTQVSGVAVSGGGGTGLTTAQLQSGSLPSGFSSSVWGAAAGFYPYLTSINTLFTVSGSAFAANGTTGASSASITFYSGGIALGTATTSGSGSYLFSDLLPAGTLITKLGTTVAPSMGNGIAGASYTDALVVASGTITNFNVTTGMLASSTRNTTATGLTSDLSNTFGSGVYSGLISNANLTVSRISAAQGFSINAALNSGQSYTLKTLGGDITIDTLLTWSGGNSLTLDSYHSLIFNAPVTISGAAPVTLRTNDGSSSGTISYGLDSPGFAGSLSFTGAGSLNINDNPYTLINSVSGLAAISGASGYYALAKPLDATGLPHSGPLIGTLSGTFDGLGNSISNVVINGGLGNVIGLFGSVSSTGTLSNLGLIGGAVSGQSYVGGIAGINGGTINNVYSRATVTGINYFTGGLVGYQTGSLNGSIAAGTVSGGADVGGLVGYEVGTGSTILGSRALGAVSGTSNIGGLVGYAEGNVTSSTANGEVTGTEFVGGAIGRSYSGIDTGDIATGAVRAGYDGGGLIGYVDGGATVNLGTTYGSVTGTTSNGSGSFIGGFAGSSSGIINSGLAAGSSSTATGVNYVGGFIGYQAAGAVSQSSSYNAVVASGNFVGGFDGGLISGSLVSVTATGMVNAGSFVGGLVGYQSGGSISLSSASGSVTGATGSFYTGGLVGVQSAGTIDQSRATGAVTGNDGVGGLVGFQDSGSGGITNSYAKSIVTGNNDTGGLIGYSSGNVSFDYATGQVAGGSFTGGLVGRVFQGSVTNSYATGAVSGASNVGGLIGYKDPTASVGGNLLPGNDYATGNVTATGDNVGGLIGYSAGDIDNHYPSTALYATGNVSGRDNVGGLVGFSDAGTFSQSKATGSVTGRNAVGGLIGNLNNGSYDQVYASGAVSSTGGNYVGGLVGFQNAGTITNSYATSSISGTASFVGGLIGYQYGGSVAQAYATGSVTGSFGVGGLVGYQENGSITNAVWDTQLSGQSQGFGYHIGGTFTANGLTTLQLQDFASYMSNYLGFDFTNIWNAPNQAGQNGSATAVYPILKNVP